KQSSRDVTHDYPPDVFAVLDYITHGSVLMRYRGAPFAICRWCGVKVTGQAKSSNVHRPGKYRNTVSCVYGTRPAAFSPAPENFFQKRRPDPGLKVRIVRGRVQEHADAPHFFALLRAGSGQGPRCRRAAKKRDELASPHSITSSARASRVGGTSRPIALAILRLMTSSYLVA